MDTIEQLTEYFRKFPGIGPRQAKRFVYYLLTQSDHTIDGLVSRIKELKRSISICPSCCRYFGESKHFGADAGDQKEHEKNADAGKLCSICRNSGRDRSLLMIVSRDVDLQAMEKSRAYKGMYFVIGGSVPILEDHPELRIRQKELIGILKQRMEKDSLKEIIIATSLNPEGEHTALYLSSLIKTTFGSEMEKKDVSITGLGRGLSTGTEIEYSDADTIKSALENRK